MRWFLLFLGALSGGLFFYRLAAPAAKQPTGQAAKSSSTGLTPYLDFDFNKLLSGDSNMKTSTKPYQQAGGDPVPKGIRNNNPLNIESNDTPWQGKIGDDGRFIIFDTAHHGIRAAARTMRTYRDRHHLDSVEEIINRWAPPSDNNPTEKYIAFVASKAGVHPQSTLSAADYPHVIGAMIHFENGYNPYDQKTIEQATVAGFE